MNHLTKFDNVSQHEPDSRRNVLLVENVWDSLEILIYSWLNREFEHALQCNFRHKPIIVPQTLDRRKSIFLPTTVNILHKLSNLSSSLRYLNKKDKHHLICPYLRDESTWTNLSKSMMHWWITTSCNISCMYNSPMNLSIRYLHIEMFKSTALLSSHKSTSLIGTLPKSPYISKSSFFFKDIQITFTFIVWSEFLYQLEATLFLG